MFRNILLVSLEDMCTIPFGLHPVLQAAQNFKDLNVYKSEFTLSHFYWATSK